MTEYGQAPCRTSLTVRAMAVPYENTPYVKDREQAETETAAEGLSCSETIVWAHRGHRSFSDGSCSILSWQLNLAVLFNNKRSSRVSAKDTTDATLNKFNLLRDFILPLSEWPGLVKQMAVDSGEEAEKREKLLITGGSTNCRAPREISVEVSQKLKNRSTTRTSYTTLGHILLQEVFVYLCSLL